MKKILVILGPTATGKTNLALYLSKKINGELIACDSRQIYKGLDIGSGKMPSGVGYIVEKQKGFWIIDGRKIYLYDQRLPSDQYTVADYIKDANSVIEKLLNEGRLPIIVGGTGFYLRALIDGLSSFSEVIDKKSRLNLEGLTLLALQKKLKGINPLKYGELNNSDKHNKRRLIRHIERTLAGQKSSNKSWGGLEKRYSILKVGLTTSRQELYQRIDDRVVTRIKQGMVDEAKDLYKRGVSIERLKSFGLEYGILADFLVGKIENIEGNEGLIKVMQRKIHGYARRQLTWFKKEKNVYWFDISQKNYISKIEKKVIEWYDSDNTNVSKN